MTLDPRDWAVIEQLQNGIAVERRPFDYLAQCADMTLEEFLTRVLRLKREGVIRRMGVRLRHTTAGMTGNALAVWRVPEEDVERVGMLFASMSEVSHCYTRTTYEGFPYNLYTMVHAPTQAQVGRVVRRMARESGVADYVMLKTLRELKKSTPRYRRPHGESE
jgi:DNA-binding Lrp family transcriptional regulator